MKSIVSLLIALFFCQWLVAQDPVEYSLSADEARALGKNKETVFDSEFGDPKGPFRWVAGADVNSKDCPSFRLMYGGGAIPHFSNTRDPFVLLKVDYFVNSRGNVFGVVYRTGAYGDTLPELEKPDPRPHDHVALSEAALFALTEEKLELLDSIFKEGFQINLPIDLKWGDTLLFHASFGSPEVVKWLLKRGADHEVRNRFGQRPIDIAIDRNPEGCEILRVPEKEEELVSGYPLGLIEEVFFGEMVEKEKDIFLSFNDKDPAPEILALAAKRWLKSKIYPVSEMSLNYKNRKTGDPGVLHELSVKKNGEDIYEWSHRQATGPFLAGGGSSGTVFRKYGYWISKMTSFWDE